MDGGKSPCRPVRVRAISACANRKRELAPSRTKVLCCSAARKSQQPEQETMNALKFSTLLALLIVSKVGRADPLDTWTWRNPIPPPISLSGVAYGSGQFVAVGESGIILTST